MKITVLSATVDTVPTAKGSYQKLELAYKGEDGQVKGKKIMSFGAAAQAFKALSKAQSGEVYDVTAVKNEASGYWDWTNATKSDLGGPVGQIVLEVPRPAGKVLGSNYETPEERAKKQVYIVRQSSLSAAIAYTTGYEVKVSGTQDIINIAKQFEAYVFDTGTVEPAGKVVDLPFEDDVPL